MTSSEREQSKRIVYSVMYGVGKERLAEIKVELHKRLLDARRNGDLPANLDVNGVSSSITAAVAGMMVMGKAGFPRSTLQGIIRTTLNLLES